MRAQLLLLSALTIALSALSQDLSLYQKRWFVNDGDTLPYRLLLPRDYDAAQQYPVLLFLHGAGERGADNEKQLVHGGRLFLQEDVRSRFPAIVVVPQCPAGSYWSNVRITPGEGGKRTFRFQKGGAPTEAMVLVQALLRQVIAEFAADRARIYVGGLSMGGMGTFEIVRRNPKLFAAAFPICGGAHPRTAGKLRKPAWWVFHGARDEVVPADHSRRMVDALKKKGAAVRFTLYPEANHNSWDQAFAEKDLLPWLFSQQQ